MVKFNEINENEIRIIGSRKLQLEKKPEISQQHEDSILLSVEQEESMDRRKLPGRESRGKMSWKVIVIIMILIGAYMVFMFKTCSHIFSASPEEYTSAAYVDITDTIINDVSLHRFIPVNAKPKMVMGCMKKIPNQYILGAMAADYGLIGDEYRIVGGFVYHGEMLSHSKSKYGFCALLKDTIIIGDDLSTSYFEQAIEEEGDFFRQHALVAGGKVVSRVLKSDAALRRALCRLKDGRICIIDTDMRVSFDVFAEALSQYDVEDAIALMGSGAAVRWAVDKNKRRYIVGADEYDFPDVVNYIVWEDNVITDYDNMRETIRRY